MRHSGHKHELTNAMVVTRHVVYQRNIANVVVGGFKRSMVS